MTKRILLSLIFGVFIILLARILVTIVGFLYTTYLIRAHSVEEFKQIINNPPVLSLVIYWSGVFVQYLSYLAAGYFFIKLSKINGRYYGALVGLIWFILSHLLIVSYSLTFFLLPQHLLSANDQTSAIIKEKQIEQIKTTLTGNLNQKLLSFAVITGLAAAGGILAHSRKSKKSTKRS